MRSVSSVRELENEAILNREIERLKAALEVKYFTDQLNLIFEPTRPFYVPIDPHCSPIDPHFCPMIRMLGKIWPERKPLPMN